METGLECWPTSFHFHLSIFRFRLSHFHFLFSSFLFLFCRAVQAFHRGLRRVVQGRVTSDPSPADSVITSR